MNNIDLMNYWIESSDEDYNVMKVLYGNKKNSWSLFLGHLVIEKLMKALYAKKNKGAPHAPKSHDLIYLADKMNLELSAEQTKLLNRVTKFNMTARYDDYKREFREKCTDEYTAEQIKNIEEVRKWLKEQLMTN